MSFLPDLTPLINQIKEFNHNQVKTNQLLTEILTELRSNPLAFNKDKEIKNQKK